MGRLYTLTEGQTVCSQAHSLGEVSGNRRVLRAHTLSAVPTPEDTPKLTRAAHGFNSEAYSGAFHVTSSVFMQHPTESGSEEKTDTN